MSLASHLANLQQQQTLELTLLRARFSTLADTLQHNSLPAQWIRDHPYLATTSAALAGFTTAQLPIHLRLPLRATAPATPPPSPAPASPTASSPYADLLPLLLNFAQQLLQPPPESPATVTPANVGTLPTPAFPHPFSPIPTTAPQKEY